MKQETALTINSYLFSIFAGFYTGTIMYFLFGDSNTVRIITGIICFIIGFSSRYIVNEFKILQPIRGSNKGDDSCVK